MINTKSAGFKKYFANTSWLFFERILRIFTGLLVGIWVARYLGVERFGLLNYAISFVGLFTIFSTLGLNSIVIKELLNSENSKNSIMGTAFGLKFGGSLFVILLLFIAVYFTGLATSWIEKAIILVVGSATVFQSFHIIDLYFQSQVQSRNVVFANIFSLLLSSILKIILILNNAPLLYFAYIILFDSITLASGLIYFYLKNSHNIREWNFDIKVAKSLLSQSFPLIISGIVVSIYMKIDQVMIKQMIDNHEVGLYASAVRLSEAWYFIPMILSTSLFPAVVNAKKVSEELYYERLQKFFNLMAISAIIIVLPIMFISEDLILFLYGKEYIEASLILSIHVISGIFVALGVASTQWVVNENMQKNASIRTIMGAILNVVLNLILIKSHGAVGASVSTLISYIFVNYLSLGMFSKTRVCFKMQTKALFLSWITNKNNWKKI